MYAASGLYHPLAIDRYGPPDPVRPQTRPIFSLIVLMILKRVPGKATSPGLCDGGSNGTHLLFRESTGTHVGQEMKRNWSGKLPDLGSERIWGTICTVNVITRFGD